jgi:trypsin
MKLLTNLLILSITPATLAAASTSLRSHRETQEVEQPTTTTANNERMFQERIIGGIQAMRGRYPYAVSLQNPQTGHFCGGSLIAKDVVLSAAHCAGGNYYAVIGRYDLDDTNIGDTVSVKTEVPHPYYNPSLTDNDFNLIFLTRETTTNNVPLVALNTEGDVPGGGDPVEVMGWGDTDPSDWGQRLSDELHSVEVNVVSNAQCSQAKGYVGWFNYQSYEGAITDNMLCAQDNNQDSCQGDSGGPLVIKGNSQSGRDDVQVGVVSWGIGCADSSFPGVYARVSAAYDWIRSEVCARSMAPPASFQCSDNSGGNLFDNNVVTVPTPTPPTASSFVAPPTPPSTPAYVGGNNDYFYDDNYYGDDNGPSTTTTVNDDDDDFMQPSTSTDSFGWSGIWCFFFGC